jgi:hypothetical protein
VPDECGVTPIDDLQDDVAGHRPARAQHELARCANRAGCAWHRPLGRLWLLADQREP